jgi:hypothetical protein
MERPWAVLVFDDAGIGERLRGGAEAVEAENLELEHLANPDRIHVHLENSGTAGPEKREALPGRVIDSQACVVGALKTARRSLFPAPVAFSVYLLAAVSWAVCIRHQLVSEAARLRDDRAVHHERVFASSAMVTPFIFTMRGTSLPWT